MPTSTEAEEHLRVIRSLMEKATIYQAISAPAALLGGTIALAVAGIAWFWAERADSPNGVPFTTTWLSVLAITSAVNLWLLRRDAHRRGEAFVSPGMRLALRAMMPALMVGGLCLFLQADGGAPMLVSLWLLLYGVSLLAAAHFAPNSIRWLGRVFFCTGALLLGSASVFDWWRGANQELIAHVLMGATFGVFHLIYAACTWPRNTSAT
jgi:hypothetical protein